MRLGGILAGGALVLALCAAPGLAGAGQDSIAAARSALDRGDGIAARAELDKALSAGAARGDIAALMGEALLVQEDYARAREWLAPGKFTPADEVRGWRMLARLERATGNLAAAGAAYDKALAKAPNDPQVWVDIGRLRYVGGEQLQAIDAANRALGAGPDNPQALALRAELLRDSAGWQAALPLYERAAALAPNDLAVLAGYAETLGEAGEARAMLVVTRTMIGLAPKDPQAWYLQAVLAARAGKVDLARSLLARAGTLPDERPNAMVLQGVLELEAGNANVAVAVFERLSLTQPANPRLQLLLARALYESGDYAGLQERFSPLAARADAPAYLLTLLARGYEDQGDRAAAAPLLDRAARFQGAAVVPIPGGDGAVGAARAALASGNAAGAEAAAAQLIRQRPGLALGYALGGDTALAQGANGLALERYGQSARVRWPDRVLLRMVEALERSQRGGEASQLVGGYLGAYPGSRMAARLSAGFLAQGGDWAHARSVLENLRQRGGNRDARLLADLSLAQLRTGDADAALQTAERAALLQPGSGVAAQAWGMALVELDREPALAAALLAKARRIGGDNPLLAEARKKLGKPS
jgi:predicted Zn-dependent protease